MIETLWNFFRLYTADADYLPDFWLTISKSAFPPYTKTLLRKILILPRVPAVFPFLRTAPLNRKSYTAAYMALRYNSEEL